MGWGDLANPLKTFLIVFHRLPSHNPAPSRKRQTHGKGFTWSIFFLPFSLTSCCHYPQTPATGPLCQESWTASLRWGPPAFAFILPLPEISPHHPVLNSCLFSTIQLGHLRFYEVVLYPTEQSYHSSYVLPAEHFLKQLIKYINSFILLLLFGVCVCVSLTRQISSSRARDGKLTHLFILTQCLAHKMDSEKVCVRWVEWISHLPTWTKDRNSTPKGIARRLKKGGGVCICIRWSYCLLL